MGHPVGVLLCAGRWTRLEKRREKGGRGGGRGPFACQLVGGEGGDVWCTSKKCTLGLGTLPRAGASHWMHPRKHIGTRLGGKPGPGTSSLHSPPLAWGAEAPFPPHPHPVTTCALATALPRPATVPLALSLAHFHSLPHSHSLGTHLRSSERPFHPSGPLRRSEGRLGGQWKHRVPLSYLWRGGKKYECCQAAPALYRSGAACSPLPFPLPLPSPSHLPSASLLPSSLPRGSTSTNSLTK